MSSNLHLKYIFFLCSTNNIDRSSPHFVASIIISTGLEFQKKSQKFQVLVIQLLPPDHKHSRRRGIINNVNKLLKFKCLNNGFCFLEFKSTWLNNDNSLNMELFFDEYLHLIRKAGTLLLFHINFTDFPPLSSQKSTVNSFNSLLSSKLSSNSNFST